MEELETEAEATEGGGGGIGGLRNLTGGMIQHLHSGQVECE